MGLGPPPPIYRHLYKVIRETNMRRRGKHQMRVLCGDPYINWDTTKTRDDIGPFLGNRDRWYAQVVKNDVIAKHHRAFLIAGSYHFLRGQKHPFDIEAKLRRDGAKTFVILAGTNSVGGYDDLDRRFDSWPPLSIALLNGNWLGELPAWPVVTGGTADLHDSSFKLKNAADALLYLGPRDSLVRVYAPRAEIDGTLYGKELLRRMAIFGFPPFIPESATDMKESPQFTRPEPPKGQPGKFPDPPKTINAPLPPRPASQ